VATEVKLLTRPMWTRRQKSMAMGTGRVVIGGLSMPKAPPPMLRHPKSLLSHLRWHRSKAFDVGAHSPVDAWWSKFIRHHPSDFPSDCPLETGRSASIKHAIPWTDLAVFLFQRPQASSSWAQIDKLRQLSILLEDWAICGMVWHGHLFKYGFLDDGSSFSLPSLGLSLSLARALYQGSAHVLSKPGPRLAEPRPGVSSRARPRTSLMMVNSVLHVGKPAVFGPQLCIVSILPLVQVHLMSPSCHRMTPCQLYHPSQVQHSLPYACPPSPSYLSQLTLIILQAHCHLIPHLKKCHAL